MSCYCKCPVALPHGAVFGLQFVIVAFPDHTHFLFVCLMVILILMGMQYLVKCCNKSCVQNR